MGEYSIGDAINMLMQKSGWKQKANEVRMREEWEKIVGKTIAKYTRDIKLYNSKLIIYTDVGPLKQELNLAKPQLIQNINEYFSEKVVTEITIR